MAYSTALAYFVESCHKLNLEDIDWRDLLKFHAFLRDDKEQAPRSCWNKFANVMSFLKANGIAGLRGMQAAHEWFRAFAGHSVSSADPRGHLWWGRSAKTIA